MQHFPTRFWAAWRWNFWGILWHLTYNLSQKEIARWNSPEQARENPEQIRVFTFISRRVHTKYDRTDSDLGFTLLSRFLLNLFPALPSLVAVGAKRWKTRRKMGSWCISGVISCTQMYFVSQRFPKSIPSFLPIIINPSAMIMQWS